MSTTTEVRFQFLKPKLDKLAANPVKVVLIFFITSILSDLLIPSQLSWLDLLRDVTFVSTTAVIAGAAGALALGNRPPRKPRKPRRRTAKLSSVGPEPPRLLPQPVSRCQICNRPLTDPRSQLAGVGPGCQKRYGSRPQYRPNPGHADWEQQRQAALALQSAEQERLDSDYRRALDTYEHEMRERRAQLASSAGRARAAARHLSVLTIAVDVGALLSFAMSEALIRVLVAAGVPYL